MTTFQPPKTVDIRHLLPKRPYSEKMGDLLGIVVHHSAGNEGAYTIAEFHVNHPKNLWSHIGYNWVIETNGRIHWTLDLEDAVPYHAGYTESAGDDLALFPDQDPRYYNNHYYAVCLVGNLSKSDPTPGQSGSLLDLLSALRHIYGPAFQIVGHKELPGKKTECPGGRVDMAVVRSKVESRIKGKEDTEHLAYPQPGDDEWLRKFPTTRDAAIAMKGAADGFGQVLLKVKVEVEETLTKLESAERQLRTIREEIKGATG